MKHILYYTLYFLLQKLLPALNTIDASYNSIVNADTQVCFIIIVTIFVFFACNVDR